MNEEPTKPLATCATCPCYHLSSKFSSQHQTCHRYPAQYSATGENCRAWPHHLPTDYCWEHPELKARLQFLTAQAAMGSKGATNGEKTRKTASQRLTHAV